MSGTQCYDRRGSRPSESALVFVIVSPIVNYFAAGTGPLRLLITDEERAVAGIGAIKAGANYASALTPIVDARAREHGYMVNERSERLAL